MDWKALLFIAAAWALLAWMANRSAFFPMPYPDGNWFLQKELNTEDVWLRSGRRRIHGWWKPLDQAPAAVLFLHGNAGNVTHRARHIAAWQKAGAAILVLDYRGYGRSEGRPTEAGLYEDALAGYRYLAGLGFPPARIFVHGESLGTVPAAHVASQAPVGGLILEAPFPSARAVAQTVLPLIGPLLVWGLDVNSRLARVRAPLLVIHGDQDEVIPYRLGRRVFDAAREPKEFWTIPGAGHNDIPETAGPEYPRRLRAFLEKALQQQNIPPAD
jgi:fermentation-respiration switch protein FrsA (DUF1100 family)